MQSHLQFGMVQGRLVQSPPGQLQWFPQDYWESEFFIAHSVGIDYIELIAERNHNPNNPIWFDLGISRIIDLTRRNHLSLHALCNDYVIDHCLLDNEEVLEQNFRLLERCRLLGIGKYIIPLFEQSELKIEKFVNFIKPLRLIADKAKECGVLVCLETVLETQLLISFLDQLAHPNISIVFDTGNRAVINNNLQDEIRVLGKQRITHIHIKDKNKDNQNVLLGTGIVNFKKIFESLVEIEYDGSYTFETERGKDPVRTALYNLEFVNFFYKEAISR